MLIALSTSGKSRNVLSAIEEARRREMKTIAFLGKGGGFTAGAADIDLIVRSGSTARIQEAQKFLLHVLCEMVESALAERMSEAIFAVFAAVIGGIVGSFLNACIYRLPRGISLNNRGGRSARSAFARFPGVRTCRS